MNSSAARTNINKSSSIALALVLALVAVLTGGCGEHRRFGNDPPIVYPTDHTVQPAVLPGKYGGSMTGTFLGDPKTLNFWIEDDADTQALLGELYDSLETRDSFTLKFVPRLAYLPKVSKDGLTYTYTLRPGLKWSDGGTSRSFPAGGDSQLSHS